MQDNKNSTGRTLGVMLVVIGLFIAVLALAACAGYTGEKGVRLALGADANVMADKFDEAEKKGEIAPAIGQEGGGDGSPLGWIGAGAAAVAGIWFGRNKIKGALAAAFDAFDRLPFQSWTGRAVPEEELAATPERIEALEKRLARIEHPLGNESITAANKAA